MSTKGKWLGWEPKAPDRPEEAPIFLESAKSDPSKTSKIVSDVFDASPLGEIQKIEAVPDRAKLTLASGVLGRAGVRFMALEGGVTIGIWSDLDGPEVRAALRAFGSISCLSTT